MTEKKRSLVSGIALVLVALLWGTTYAIIKDGVRDMSPLTMMTLRFGLSAVFLVVVFGRRLAAFSRQDWYRGSIIGIFMFLAFLALVMGILYTTASKQAFIIGSYVLMVPFLAWWGNGVKPDGFALAGAVMATVGIGLLTLHDTLGINIGDGISVVGAVFFACHMVAIDRFAKTSDPIGLTIVQFAVTAILFLVCTGIFEGWQFAVPARMVWPMVYLILVATVLAFVVQNIAQRYISATSTALILTLEAAFGSLFAVIFLQEVLTPAMLVGCIIIFLGIVTQETKWRFLRQLPESAE